MEQAFSKERDLAFLFEQISAAFAGVPVPPLFADISTQADFEMSFMGIELNNTIRQLFDYSDDEVLYLTPYLMRGYLIHYGKDWSLDDDLANYLFWFAGFQFDNKLVRDRYLLVYKKFNLVQRRCVCSFLNFLLKYKMDEGFLENQVIAYWCDEVER